jgi:iron(III) transport system permease protein
MFPYVIPGSVLGITLLLAFNKRPLLLAGTSAIIVITFVTRRISYTIRSSSAILYQIAVSTEEAAIGLGDSELASFLKVTTRIMMPGVLSGAILSWITCINELSASVLLYTGKTNTMSVAIFTEVNRGNYGTAAALSAILTLTTVVSLLILFKVTGNK